ncbi:MAG: type II secretion system protein [Phycisphaerae bacterium]|nr:type II secretion system protein [Phycisphaerae bacterium]
MSQIGIDNGVSNVRRSRPRGSGLLSSAPLRLNRRKISAFTLVELLVVIAILVLLISMLLPPLNKAKEEARVSICLTNLRTMGVAFTNYSSGNNHWYPSGAAYGGSSTEYTWDSILRPYYQSFGLIHCPSDKLIRNYYSWMEGVFGYTKPRSYAINLDVSWMGPSAYGDNPDEPDFEGRGPYNGQTPPFRWPGWVRKTTDVEIPGETILLGEEWEFMYWSGYPTTGIYHYYLGCAIMPYRWGNYNNTLRRVTWYHRNNDSANFLFCDGHATTLREDNPKVATTTEIDSTPDDIGYYWRREK